MKAQKSKGPAISDTELIYADKVIGVGLGAGVSKIILGLEDEAGVARPHYTLIVPTHALLDLVGLVDKTVRDDVDLKNALDDQWRKLSEKFGAKIDPTPFVELGKTPAKKNVRKIARKPAAN